MQVMTERAFLLPLLEPHHLVLITFNLPYNTICKATAFDSRHAVDFRASESSWIEAPEGVLHRRSGLPT